MRLSGSKSSPKQAPRKAWRTLNRKRRRNQWHTFWNAGDGPCRILEIISPAGFEHFFDEGDPFGFDVHPEEH